MLRKIIFVVVVLCALWMMAGCVPACIPPTFTQLPVNLYPQHRDCWCWAASTEMISEYYDNRILQADSANFVHGQPPDCSQGCDCWGWGWGASIQDIKDNWTHWNFSYSYKASELSWTELKNKISVGSGCGSSPIMVTWWWYPVGQNGGHVVVAYGFSENKAGNFVYYRDPWQPDFVEPANPGDPCVAQAGGGSYVSTYQAFVDDTVHQWGDSFYQFARK